MTNLQLVDVVDWDQVERMLDQHDRYEFGRVAVARLHEYGFGVTKAAWYVYVGNEEHTVRMCPDASPTAYDTLAEALEVALSPANHELWGIG